MCNAKDWIIRSPMGSVYRDDDSKQPHLKRCKVRVRCLVKRRRLEVATKMESMELKNIKLYLENKSILEENEKLRQKAIYLRQENQALFFAYRDKLNLVST